MNFSWRGNSGVQGQPVSVVGKIFSSLFLSVFLLAGLFFFGFMCREIWGTASTYRWPSVPCVIESCSVTNSGDDYRLAVVYRYEFEGQTLRSDRYARQVKSISDYRAAQQLADSYPVGATRRCFVNPAKPSEAILKHGDLWLVLFLFLPLVFIAVGGGGIYKIWHSKADEPPKSSVSPGWGHWWTGIFFAVFFFVGAGTFYELGVRPMLKMLDAQQWTATPCEVVSSEVRTHSGDDGPMFSANVLYRYEVNGREYRSNKRTFMSSSSSGYEGKAKIVAQFPTGTKMTCYVNPRDPTEAVLERGFKPMMLLGLIPLIFFAVGAGGLWWVFKTKAFRKPVEGVPAWQQNTEWAEGRIRSSNKIGMWAMWGVAVFWNSLSWFFTVLAFSQDKPSKAVLFVLLFPAAGLFLLWLAIRQTALWLRFGESFFELTSGPGVIGGVLAGKIQLSRFMRVEDGFKVRLSCVYIETGADSNTERIRWQKELFVSSGGTDAIPVNFYIPSDCEEACEVKNSYRILWRLMATGRVDGAKYEARFDVPVIRAALTKEQEMAAQRAKASEQGAVARYEQPMNSRILVQTSARGGKEFYFPAARNPGSAAGFTVFLAVWSVGIWFMIAFKAPIVFPIVFGVFEAVFIFMALQMWTGTTQVMVERDELTVTKTWLGIQRKHTTPTAEIVEIHTKVGMTAGSTTYQDIQIICQGGVTFIAGSSIKDMGEAEWLAAEMAKAAGVVGK